MTNLRTPPRRLEHEWTSWYGGPVPNLPRGWHWKSDLYARTHTTSAGWLANTHPDRWHPLDLEPDPRRPWKHSGTIASEALAR